MTELFISVSHKPTTATCCERGVEKMSGDGCSSQKVARVHFQLQPSAGNLTKPVIPQKSGFANKLSHSEAMNLRRQVVFH